MHIFIQYALHMCVPHVVSHGASGAGPQDLAVAVPGQLVPMRSALVDRSKPAQPSAW